MFSQVVLSFGIPFALVPLLLIARKPEVMGGLVNPGWLTAIASVIAAMIIGLNLFLLSRRSSADRKASRSESVSGFAARMLERRPTDAADQNQ